ncbi:Isoprenylcysteine carboxyl methyltransferase family-domain-containing protein [Xylogone sp. PMI_703]|nr:Isoprenylcysteine carboxyl methyltransferase family-domain-containing protein [Xylogone sp. PMI_703]
MASISNNSESMHTSQPDTASEVQNRNQGASMRPTVFGQIMNNGGLGVPPPATPNRDASRTPESISVGAALDVYEKQFFPGQPKSLSGIAVRSLSLGMVFSTSMIVSIAILCITGSPLWRPPFFLAALCAFHFLEFWTTARYNTNAAKVSSFLFSTNGHAYTAAHTTATLECIITNALFPNRAWLPPSLSRLLLLLGLFLVVLGQSIRSIAMIQAGSNFNHIVQRRKAQTHKLVTTGIYHYLRHPSYFGFFWWGLGTQLVLGNPVCFLAYTTVLWRFFSRRIKGEEELLIHFFGDEYVKYRDRTVVGIPMIS